MKKTAFEKIKRKMVRKLREENLVVPPDRNADVSQKIGRPSDPVEMMSAEEFFGNLDD